MNRTPKALPTILLIEEDDDTRPLLRRYLCESEFDVIVGVDAQEAIERVRYTPQRPSVILLNQVGRSIDQFLEMGRQVRQQGELPADTPVVVIAERYEAAKEGKNFQVSDHEYVAHLVDAQQLLTLLQGLSLSRNELAAAKDGSCSCGCSTDGSC